MKENSFICRKYLKRDTVSFHRSSLAATISGLKQTFRSFRLSLIGNYLNPYSEHKVVEKNAKSDCLHGRRRSKLIKHVAF